MQTRLAKISANFFCLVSNKIWGRETGCTRTKFKARQNKEWTQEPRIRCCCCCLVVQTDNDNPVSNKKRVSWAPEDRSESQERQQGTGNHRSSATKENGLGTRRKTINRERQSTCSSHIPQADPNSRNSGIALKPRENRNKDKRDSGKSSATGHGSERKEKAGLK